jgi:hypothetical protein
VLPFLYPPRELLRSYRAGEFDFPAFALAYRRGLDAECGASLAIQDWLAGVPGLGDFTLLCFEAVGQPCHRLPLAEWLLERAPGLQVGELR